MKLETMSLDINKFTRHDRETLVAFASDFGPLGTKWIGQLYDDACDAGITIRGVTQDVTFLLTKEHTNGDGELTHWEFVRIISKTPCVINRVLVYND